jgi:hypothetical protein
MQSQFTHVIIKKKAEKHRWMNKREKEDDKMLLFRPDE